MTEHPFMDEGLRRWIIVTANRNFWRVAKWYDKEDLIQDGLTCYYKCLHQYGNLSRKRRPTKEDRKQFMALVKRTYENYIHDLANRHTRTTEDTASQFETVDAETASWIDRQSADDEPVEIMSVLDASTIVDWVGGELKRDISVIAMPSGVVEMPLPPGLRKMRNIILTKAEVDLAQLAYAFITAPGEVKYIKTKVGKYTKRETLEAYLCRILEVDLTKSVDIVEGLRQYFSDQLA